MNKGAQVVEDIKKTTGNDKVEVMKMDLTPHLIGQKFCFSISSTEATNQYSYL